MDGVVEEEGNFSLLADDLEQVEYTPYSERPETYVVPVLFALIFLAGVLGNGTLVVIFARHRTMRNAPNTYIISLALGDLLVIVTCVPFTSIVYTLESWPWGTLVCKLSECAKDVSIGVSVFTLTALSAERYCAIVNPMRRHAAGRLGARLGSRLLAVLSAAAIWALALLLALPAALYSHVPEVNLSSVNRTIQVCNPFPEYLGEGYAAFMVLFKFLTYYAVPLVIITVFYTMMAAQLQSAARCMPGEPQGQSAQVRARKKVAKMVLAFVAIFFLCFLPYHVFMLWFHLYPNSRLDYNLAWHGLRIVGFCLSYINSCVNPITLYCVSGAFRKHFNNYLFCCCARPGQARARSGSTCTAARADGADHTSLAHLRSTVRGRCHAASRHNSTVQTALFHTDKTCDGSPPLDKSRL
ncbi:neuropeptide CCHamide-1 receptor-like [Schistocerca gregaria]|uniref:neuropeptide CCHamide-1 receptor-like n=1 Tax=Schistocerca gregaria TaxID=7010 RepID=UPI00211E9F0A|nr:neuropeptide CCHamide-1 receptor-like [Schistocerca gregaria]